MRAAAGLYLFARADFQMEIIFAHVCASGQNADAWLVFASLNT
jgi:hypothetical protein